MQPVVRPAPILGHFLACSSFFGGLRSFGFRVQGLASFLLVAFDIAVVASRLKLVRLTATRETKRERESERAGAHHGDLAQTHRSPTLQSTGKALTKSNE